MKAITLWQPWASLIAEGVKTIETRGRRSPWHTAIGQMIGIHAAKCRGGWGTDVGGDSVRALWNTVPEISGRIGVPFDEWPRGAVLAVCRLVDVVPMWAPNLVENPDLGGVLVGTTSDPDKMLAWTRAQAGTDPVNVTDQRPFGDYSPGRWALLLDDVVKLDEPVPARGRQGLWEWSR